MKSKIKAVIFDMDGVLIEAKDWHYEALNRALSLFGHSISRYDHLTAYDGLPTSKKLDMLSRERNLPRKLHSFLNELKQKFTMELIHSHCKPRFYHEFALSKLNKEGYKLGCASNSVRNTVEVMLSKSELLKYMDVILSAQDVKNPKPSPDIYNEAMRLLSLRPEECLIVEDNENGIAAAKASGAHLMIVQNVDEVNITNIHNKILKISELEVD